MSLWHRLLPSRESLLGTTLRTLLVPSPRPQITQLCGSATSPLPVRSPVASLGTNVDARPPPQGSFSRSPPPRVLAWLLLMRQLWPSRGLMHGFAWTRPSSLACALRLLPGRAGVRTDSSSARVQSWPPWLARTDDKQSVASCADRLVGRARGKGFLE